MEDVFVALIGAALTALAEVVIHRLAERYFPSRVTAGIAAA
jgi:hypothetical protein